MVYGLRSIGLYCVTMALLAGCQTATPWGPDAARWTGRWQVEGPLAHGGDLSCIAERMGEQNWRAEFTGSCDADETFLFDVTMAGKRDGENVVFTGRTDLGKKNGGRYEWSGKIDEDTFTGKYVSRGGESGSFSLQRDEKWKR